MAINSVFRTKRAVAAGFFGLYTLSILTSVLCVEEAHAQQGSYYALEYFAINGEKEGPDLPPVTNEGEVLERQIEVHDFLFGVERPKAAHMYAYANYAGRVRLLLDTDLARDTEFFAPAVAYDGQESFQKYHADLWWDKQFIRGSDPDRKVKATILPSFLRFYAPRVPTGVPIGEDSDKTPSAQWEFHIYLLRGSDQVLDRKETSISQTVEVSGLTSNGIGALGAKVEHYGYSTNPLALLDRNGDQLPPIPYLDYISPEGELMPEGYVPKNSYRYEITDNFTHEIDLSHIEEGELYGIAYRLLIKGGTYDDGYVWGYIADPLETTAESSGVRLEIDDPAADEEPGRRCDELFNAHRYVDNKDGTATDRYTALMWQRCPTNHSLVDPGTPGDLTDDMCELNAGAEERTDWQNTLTQSVSDSSGGYGDWRAPNVKELETLVTNCLASAIEPELFPDTPIDRGFWSSTPGRYIWQQYINPADIAADAWQVDFANGDLQTSEKTALAYSRLVRDTGELPIAPLPAISAGRAAIEEGDSGSSVLEIPVALDTAGTADVTVDYVVIAPNNNAVNGVDFDETAGTLVFAPGETLKKVAVTIYGNIDATRNKTLDLTLSNNSANSRIAAPFGIGTIIDDDPFISLGRHTVQAFEGSSAISQSVIRVPVFLDRPAAQPITVDYELLQGTAEFGTDTSGFVNGTITFQSGSKVSYVDINPVSDDVLENDETLTVEISNPTGAKLAPGSGDTLQQLVVLVNDDNAGTYTALNDTGLTSCATTADNAQACPQTGLPVQDAEQGRDADPSSNDSADGDVGFSFTKLDDVGAALPSSAGNWSCVNDNVTGLIWETKTANVSSPIENNDLHSSRWTYSWYNSTGINDGGYAGVQNGGTCIDTINCDTEKFVAAVNAEALCGYTDWRLPSIDELYTIVDMTGDFSAQIEYARGASGTTRYFPYPQLDVSSGPWSSSTAAGRDNGANAWYLSDNGMAKKDKGELRATPLPVRLVRGGIIAR